MTAAAEFHNWADIAEAGNDDARRREIAGVGASLKQVRVKAGATAPRHSHPHEQFVMVLEGEVKLTTEEGERRIGPGGVIRFPPEVRHAAAFDVDTVIVEVNVAAG